MNKSMKPVHVQDPFLEQALAEHDRLHIAATNIQHYLEQHTAADATTANVEHAIGLIELLCEELTQHFAREEEGGYLEEAITRIPAVAPQVATLLKQHQDLLKVARSMIVAAKGAQNIPSAWTALQVDCQRYLKKLMAHEAAENAILERGFNEDLRLQ